MYTAMNEDTYTYHTWCAHVHSTVYLVQVHSILSTDRCFKKWRPLRTFMYHIYHGCFYTSPINPLPLMGLETRIHKISFLIGRTHCKSRKISTATYDFSSLQTNGTLGDKNRTLVASVFIKSKQTEAQVHLYSAQRTVHTAQRTRTPTHI